MSHSWKKSFAERQKWRKFDACALGCACVTGARLIASAMPLATPGALLARHDPEIELAPLQIDADHSHARSVAQTIAPVAPTANQAVRLFLVVVVIVRQCADMHQAFH